MSNATMEKQPGTAEDDRCISGPLEWTILIVAIVLGIALLLFLIRKLVQGPFYRKKNRIDGKVVVITGCNTGIGKETALELASRGAKIYMACRDPVRCEGARLEIIEKTKNENIFNRTLDLSSLESVRKFADKFLAEEPKLDILINNAGIMACPKGTTKDGFDLQLGTNHLGHFLLTNLLLDSLKQSAPSRIVVVSSAIYIFGKINKEDLNWEKSYSKWGAYSQSKLANILFTRKLNEMLHGTQVTVNCCHPGVVKTELSRHIISGRTKSLLRPVTRFFFKSPKAGAQTSIRLALDPDLEKSSGAYYFDTIKCPVLPKAKNKEMADYLWKISEEMVGLRPKEQMTVVPVTLHVPPKSESNGHTTVIDVESAPNDMPDNKKMEEAIIKSNGISEKSEKMKKMSESEKQDEPEKVDKSEKMEKMEVTITRNEPEESKKQEKMDLPEKIDTSEKFEKMNMTKTNGEMVVSEDKPDGVEMKHEMQPRQAMEKKDPMENINAIEKASDVIEKNDMKETTESVAEIGTREKAI
ncbi:retinol dehydrogenase 12 [Episyrphus balteatus]|uniref:retinol dehydrogenase 12 n=1 Tax=Episyrphus balteatus TaxID=286459 RepID=UPI00248515F8|nr:retinol dehydrogenase 12 [Episyrphus balteatus]